MGRRCFPRRPSVDQYVDAIDNENEQAAIDLLHEDSELELTLEQIPSGRWRITDGRAVQIDAEVSPSARSGSHRQTPRESRCVVPCVRRGHDSAAWAYSGSYSVREPRKGCGGFNVPTGTRYLRAQRPIPHRRTVHHVTAGGHGPCHQPASPFCHVARLARRQGWIGRGVTPSRIAEVGVL